MKTILISLLLSISISTFGQYVERSLISFDGLYETKCEFEDADDEDGTQSYLRFYPDGKVISVGTDCEGTIDELKDWFHVNAEQVSVGNYEINGRKMHFSTTGKAGTVNYKCKIMAENIIKVKWKSRINRERGKEEYKFVKLTGLK